MAGPSFFTKSCAHRCLLCVLVFALLPPGISQGQITRVSADQNRILISGLARVGGAGIAELAPNQSTNDLAAVSEVGSVKATGPFTISISRWDGPRDRLYSGFLAFQRINGLASCSPRGNALCRREMRQDRKI